MVAVGVIGINDVIACIGTRTPLTSRLLYNHARAFKVVRDSITGRYCSFSSYAHCRTEGCGPLSDRGGPSVPYVAV